MLVTCCLLRFDGERARACDLFGACAGTRSRLAFAMPCIAISPRDGDRARACDLSVARTCAQLTTAASHNETDIGRAPVSSHPIHNNDACGPHRGENRGLVFLWTLGGLVLQSQSQAYWVRP